jgi:DNA-binding response OmpR family regulator
MNTSGVRVLVVEDEPHARQTLATHLRHEGFQVQELDNGLDALGLLRRGAVAIALVDLTLPEIDGLELVRRVRRESTVSIIMLTASHHEPARLAALEAGADDLLIKPVSLAEVTARLRAQLRRARGFKMEQTVLRTGLLELDLGARRCTCGGREIELTRREFDLLGSLLRYPGRIHTRRQLLELVWGSLAVSPQAVDANIASLRRKLGSAISIVTLRGVGYRLDPASVTVRTPSNV